MHTYFESSPVFSDKFDGGKGRFLFMLYGLSFSWLLAHNLGCPSATQKQAAVHVMLGDLQTARDKAESFYAALVSPSEAWSAGTR